jgi:hypothetical protein
MHVLIQNALVQIIAVEGVIPVNADVPLPMTI